ncbi:DUF2889 domain-containing protein [Caballeronia sp. GAWG2-1]|uniref:DUF2889 domain-containing protein n=1 Tax=Caballeronia sp. GAWG2-1 TaxID=2921744 RepID=UPI002028F044|nr:DUF2889 domain-containing protein [Caballeronia sp. GAWG2-1]
MPLPDSQPREELHCRRIDLRGYRRMDGLYDIEAHLLDTRSRTLELDGGKSLQPGEALHEMSIRLVVDEDLHVRDVVAVTDAAPFPICPEAASTLQSIKGMQIGPGWTKAIRERLSGADSCTHLKELLGPLATVAFQSLFEVRRLAPESLDADGRPRKIDSCFAYASDRELVLHKWPGFYDGPPVRSE